MNNLFLKCTRQKLTEHCPEKFVYVNLWMVQSYQAAPEGGTTFFFDNNAVHVEDKLEAVSFRIDEIMSKTTGFRA